MCWLTALNWQLSASISTAESMAAQLMPHVVSDEDVHTPNGHMAKEGVGVYLL